MSNIEQKLPCEVVQDILPLYHDGVCSGASRKMVENHLQECRTCKTLLQEMDETEMDMALADETKEVLEHHAKRERTLAYKTAVVIAGLLLLPIVIALLMTLPGYSDLKTDAAIMASMLLVAGFTVVPLLLWKCFLTMATGLRLARLPAQRCLVFLWFLRHLW